MAGIIATFQNEERYANKSTEVVVAQRKPGVAEAESARDFGRQCLTITALWLARLCGGLYSVF